MKTIVPTRAEVADAVEAFNARYADMDGALWCLSRAARPELLRGESGQALEQLIWKVRSWWGVQGVVRETACLAARALAGMEWSQTMFSDDIDAIKDPIAFATYRVTDFVQSMMGLGVPRKEFSLSTKVLHWLMPWRTPAYDSFVRASLAASGPPEYAYIDIVTWQFENAVRLMAEGSDWLGVVEPRSPLRALDKYLWHKGGGAVGTAVVIKDPWEVCRELKIIDR
jgi:hypothetical protein